MQLSNIFLLYQSFVQSVESDVASTEESKSVQLEDTQQGTRPQSKKGFFNKVQDKVDKYEDRIKGAEDRIKGAKDKYKGKAEERLSKFRKGLGKRIDVLRDTIVGE